MLTFTVYGEPAPQGSKKSIGNGRFIESSKRLKPWRAVVADSAFKAWVDSGLPRFEVPVVVSVVFFIRRGKSVKREWPVSRTDGDTDKLLRAIGDALSVDSGVLADDSLIVKWNNPVKIYADGHEPGAWIRIREANSLDKQVPLEWVLQEEGKVTDS